MTYRLLLGILLTAVVAAPGRAQVRPPAPRLVIAYPKVCKHGLYVQPRPGRYAVMLFCDDAQGSHIGVVCYEPGCESSDDGPWGLADRFWQDDAWASDVTAFAWDANVDCLYVSTSEIYGTGDLYLLNLSRRRATAIRIDPPAGDTFWHSTQLLRIDLLKKLLWYAVDYSNATGREVKIERSLNLPACEH